MINGSFYGSSTNGPGIPEELRERVFERFFHIVGNQATGSGLRLSILLQIAKLHNAEIALKTQKTCFFPAQYSS